jgi:hypothetical protein
LREPGDDHGGNFLLAGPSVATREFLDGGRRVADEDQFLATRNGADFVVQDVEQGRVFAISTVRVVVVDSNGAIVKTSEVCNSEVQTDAISREG